MLDRALGHLFRTIELGDSKIKPVEGRETECPGGTAQIEDAIPLAVKPLVRRTLDQAQ